ncbi:hypothetical protein [Roseateles sp.]|uniref:hypothetical protein n=1 Tax=Roseateles sp. TaxID=1971397 RepID=UPI0031DC360A
MSGQAITSPEPALAVRLSPGAPGVEVPEALIAALGDWARQVMESASAPLRDSLSRTEDELASARQSHQQSESERDALNSQLAQITEQRDQALSKLAEREAAIERLTVELRHARDIASDALVGKAKDQLAIAGKDSQLADLRKQLERQVATSAAESDARLAAEMELVGATTARDNFAAEIAALRAQLDAGRVSAGTA